MAPLANDRKRRFRVALALHDMTQGEWASGQGVTGGHLTQVLNGRESQKLTDAIDAFIADTFRTFKVKAA